MKKTIEIDGKKMVIEANGLLPRLYKKEFGGDLFGSMKKLVDNYEKDPEGADTEVLENVTWLMLRAGGTDVPPTVEEWLEGISDILSLYKAFKDVSSLWGKSQKTTSKPKKK